MKINRHELAGLLPRSRLTYNQQNFVTAAIARID
jgi:hypothetical protein